MRLFSSILCIIMTFSFHGAQAKQPCGLDDNGCKIELGEYHIELPDRADPSVKIPAVLYFHGAGGSGKRSLKNREMVETFLRRGYAIIAPSGLKRPNSRFGPGWSFHPDRKKQRNELAFTKAMLDDASKKFNLDRDEVLMTGFSIGGSLTWYLACQDATVAKAYAPIAGAFWRPHPNAADCDGPIKLLHTHGWQDGTVPLEGRPIGPIDNPRIVQGDVFYGLQLMREINECPYLKADKYDTKGKFLKRWWTRCHPDSALQFNLFAGGHSVTKGWASEAINWFEGLDSNASQ